MKQCPFKIVMVLGTGGTGGLCIENECAIWDKKRKCCSLRRG